MEYALTMDTIKQQLLSRKIVIFDLNGWISTNKLELNLDITYYKDWNWALREVQHDFDVVDRLCVPAVEG